MVDVLVREPVDSMARRVTSQRGCESDIYGSRHENLLRARDALTKYRSELKTRLGIRSNSHYKNLKAMFKRRHEKRVPFNLNRGLWGEYLNTGKKMEQIENELRRYNQKEMKGRYAQRTTS